MFISAQHGGERGDTWACWGRGRVDPGRQREQMQGKVEECTDDASGRKMTFWRTTTRQATLQTACGSGRQKARDGSRVMQG